MSEPTTFSDRAADLASQAVEAAGPVIERAREVAGDLAEKAGPYVEKAGELAASGVAAAAEQLDRATNGRYADTISSVASKIEKTLDPGKS